MSVRTVKVTGSIAGGAIVATVLATWLTSTSAQTQTAPRYLPEYTASGDLVLPKNFREWVFVGSPLTPIALNGGKACPEGTASSEPCTGFPEFHNVYIEPGSYEIYKKTNVFPEGTIFFKELQLTLPAENPDGSRTEPSGRGYFPGKLEWRRRDRKGLQALRRQRWMGLLQFQPSRTKSANGQTETTGRVRLLPYRQRQERRGLDPVLSAAG